MIEKREQAPDWVLTGDNSREEFLWWLCGEKLPLDLTKPVQVRYGDHLATEFQNGGWQQISTPRLLPDTMLLYENETQLEQALDAAYDLHWHGYDRYLVCEGFPFRRERSQMLLESIYRKDPKADVLIVLMDTPRHRGATDLPTERDEAVEARNSYLADGQNVCLIKNPGDLLEALTWRGALFPRWKRYVRQEMEKLEDRIRGSTIDCNEVKLYWQSVSGPLGKNAQIGRFSFSSVQHHGKDTLWDNYYAEAFGLLFGSEGNNGILSDVVNIYDYTFYSGDSLAYWDKEKESSKIWAEMEHRFRERMRAGRPARMSRRQPKNQTEYQRMITEKGSPDYGVETRFKAELESFLGMRNRGGSFEESPDEVFQVIRDQMNLRYREMKDQLEAQT